PRLLGAAAAAADLRRGGGGGRERHAGAPGEERVSRPRRAVVTGLGAVSGFGPGAERLWRALVDGKRAMARRAELEEAGLPPTAALVPDRDPRAPGDAIRFALDAVAEALADAGLAGADGLLQRSNARNHAIDPERVAVSVGTTLGGIAPWLDVVRE